MLPRLNLGKQPSNLSPLLRLHRQHVDDVGPIVAMSVAVAHQAGGDRVAVGSRTLEHFAQTAKVTEHAPRGRDTSRNSLVPLGASESPRLALGPAVSVPRYLAPHDRAWQAGSLARKVVPGNFTTGLVSSRYLGFGVSQIPRRHR